MRRFATKTERHVVKAFIQKDKTIRCPEKGQYYALIDADNNELLSALCVTDHRKDLGYYKVNGMRTEKKHRKHGYSSELLAFALSQPEYRGNIIHANALSFSKGIFERFGFKLISVQNVAKHKEYQFERKIE